MYTRSFSYHNHATRVTTTPFIWPLWPRIKHDQVRNPMSARAKRISKAKPAMKRLFEEYISSENSVSVAQTLEEPPEEEL